MTATGDVLTPYELERAAIIASNSERMKSIGVAESADRLRATANQEQKKQRIQARRSPAPRTPAEIRTSSRIAGLPAKQYSENVPLYRHDDDEERPSKKRRGSRTSLRRASTGGGRGHRGRGWNETMGWSSEPARHRAYEAARKCAEELKNPSGFKMMSQSQVSGGFWLQLPRGFPSPNWTPASNGTTFKVKVLVKRAAGKAPGIGWSGISGLGYKHDQELDAWDVVFLWRDPRGSAGLSGGWVNVAVDQMIFPDDSVAFEKVSDKEIRIHIFRAADFEQGDLKKQRQAIVEALSALPATDAVASDAATAADDAVKPGEGGSKEGEGEGAAAAEPSSPAEGGRAKAAQAKLEGAAGPATPAGENGTTGARARKKAATAVEAAEAAAGKAPKGAATKGAAPKEAKTKGAAGAGSVAVGKKRGRVGVAAVEEEEVFTVEAVLDWGKTEKGVLLLKIRWVGYGPEHDTWEPLESLDAPPRSYPWRCEVPACVPEVPACVPEVPACVPEGGAGVHGSRARRLPKQQRC